jgi:hypothetical protein
MNTEHFDDVYRNIWHFIEKVLQTGKDFILSLV